MPAGTSSAADRTLLGTDFVAQPDKTAAAVTAVEFREELNRLRNETQAAAELEQKIVAASVAMTGSLSAGYVLWLIRGGVLLSSLLSSLPAWRALDPLPVLAKRGRRDDEDDDSLESLVDKPVAPQGSSNTVTATEPQSNDDAAETQASGAKESS
jgi:hypothetical protein